MHVLVTAVGNRTEHWVDLFKKLGERPDVELTIFAANVSPLTRREVGQLSERNPRVHFHLAPTVLSEGATGHMASAVFRPGSASLLDSTRPDVIHIVGEAAYLSTYQVLRMRRRRWPDVPVTLYAAQNVVTRFPFPFPLLEQRAYRQVTCAFPITPTAHDVLRTKGFRAHARLVPLGVDTQLFQPRERPGPRPFTVGFVGRLEPHKGIGDLLQAGRRLDCDLLFVGAGSMTPDVEREVAARPGRVELHPWVSHDDLPGLLARTDVLALPSVEVIQRNVAPWIAIPLREQFGRVLVEAMACGVPVVGSDVGEIPYVIDTAGLVFPAGDAAALTDRLAQIRDDAVMARKLGRAGYERAQQFGWVRIADRMCEIWQSLIDTGHPGPEDPTSPESGPMGATAPATGRMRDEEGHSQ